MTTYPLKIQTEFHCGLEWSGTHGPGRRLSTRRGPASTSGEVDRAMVLALLRWLFGVLPSVSTYVAMGRPMRKRRGDVGRWQKCGYQGRWTRAPAPSGVPLWLRQSIGGRQQSQTRRWRTNIPHTSCHRCAFGMVASSDGTHPVDGARNTWRHRRGSRMGTSFAGAPLEELECSGYRRRELGS